MTKKKRKLSNKIKWMQRFFAVAGLIAPKATLHLLVKWLFTPQKRPLKPAHIDCLNKAEKFSLEVDEFKNPDKKLMLSCYRWGNGEKTVLLAHGWDARAVDFYRMIPALVQNGYQVIAFDGPGHGNSEGERGHLLSFEEVMYTLIKKIGTPYAIIGHSMGGGAAVHMLMDHDIRVQKLVAITIPMVLNRFFEGVFTTMMVPSQMQRVFFNGIEEEFGEPLENFDLIECKDPIKAGDIFIVYDGDDKIVPEQDINEFLKRQPNVKHLNMKGIGHYSIIKNKQVIEGIVDFLKSPSQTSKVQMQHSNDAEQ